MRKLWPPLTDISRLLSPPENVSAEASPCGDAADADAAPAPPMPVHIAELIQRQVAARDAFPPQAPVSGLLIRLWELPRQDAPWPFDGTLAMLLDRQDVSGFWHGWMAAGETDYATDADVLLEPGDEPFDPSAGVIQIWNPLRLRIDGSVKPLGRIAADRLVALRNLAGALDAGGFMSATAYPGRMQLREITGIQLLCGTPMGSPNDPRWAYRALYGAAAARLQEAWNLDAPPVSTPRVAKASSSVGWGGWLSQLLKPGFAYAAVVVLAVGNLVLLLERDSAPEDYSQTRSAGAQVKRVPEIEIRFRDNVRLEDISALLQDIRGAMAGGPGQLGSYRIALPEGNVTEAINKLRASPIVESVNLSEDKP